MAVRRSGAPQPSGGIAVVGGGPAGLLAAIALARRGIPTTVFERDGDPRTSPRFDPDRSYTIDITGHGHRALQHVDATRFFDRRLLPFRGIQHAGRVVEHWREPGWTGSRGDIVRALTDAVEHTAEGRVQVHHGRRVGSVDVATGEVAWGPAGDPATTRRFGLVVGADGAGSVVRRAMQEQVPGFVVRRTELPNHLTMVELDRLSDQLDPHFLQALATRPFCVAGAIRADQDGGPPRWFCAVGTRHELRFASPDDARAWLRRHCPRVLDLASPDAVAAFARRRCYHVGQKLTCSALSAGRCVLIGDAAGPFPPIGQGVNAALESAMVLDRCLERAGATPEGCLAAAALYDRAWGPEVEAVSWISTKMLFENRLHMLRADVTMRLGLNVVGQAKDGATPWSVVAGRARRLGPLWW
ncbi:FAD-dependent monooxygenase [Geodermatophilus sp. YIM 151500]|uniref:FAD-dependent oxidoreductase n=1 Tax=Geodermatophilus sp. YIM 151500 TaxID=2984531 RepID=UPI0021E4BC60|nr:NAD(P)/FAD-dependent oxidoreductase [Geodermatophilus sp. YIM 151500]MCV2488091.1 FAD-dependent monooxygenase [Geodermatophilus sp. YIM 151500]